jgi:hypothetical protein
VPRRSLLLAGLAVVAAAGCSKGPPGITLLTGRVTVDGKPLQSGLVSIMSLDNVTQSNAVLNPDGTYRIAGAPTGPVKVYVDTENFKETDPIPNERGEIVVKAKPNPLYVKLPAKYGSYDTSGLRTEIPRGASATYDIELSAK